MGLKKRSKVSAQFNMSSLTDIIFLLLIFFMLTSSLVAPNALNLKLPGSQKDRVTNTKELDDVRIGRSGTYYYNGERSSLSDVESRLRRISQGSNPSITISPESGTATENVVAIMDIALRFNINAILTTELE